MRWLSQRCVLIHPYSAHLMIRVTADRPPGVFMRLNKKQSQAADRNKTSGSIFRDAFLVR